MRLFCDEQIPHIWAVKLGVLGFDVVECAQEPTLRAQHDVDMLLPWANKHRRIFVTCDRMKDQPTRRRLLERLHRTGAGRVLYVSGGPGIGWQRGVGKILLHERVWSEFFANGHGLVHLRDERPPDCQRINELPRVVRVPVEQGWQYVYANRLRREGPKNQNKARRRRAPDVAADERLFP